MVMFQARPKYLRCIGITCFYLAAKTLEEDEVIIQFIALTFHTGKLTLATAKYHKKCDMLHMIIKYIILMLLST